MKFDIIKFVGKCRCTVGQRNGLPPIDGNLLAQLIKRTIYFSQNNEDSTSLIY